MNETRSSDVRPLGPEEIDRLRLMRLDRGWSYRQMAEQVGVTERTLRNVLEALVERPHDTTVYRIRQWLSGQQEVA